VLGRANGQAQKRNWPAMVPKLQLILKEHEVHPAQLKLMMRKRYWQQLPQDDWQVVRSLPKKGKRNANFAAMKPD